MSYLRDYLSYLFGNKKGSPYDLPVNFDWGGLSLLSFQEQLMFHALAHKLDDFVSTLDFKNLSQQDLYQLFTYQELIRPELFQTLIDIHKLHFDFYLSAIHETTLNLDELQSLIDFNNDRLTVFAIFPHGRKKPGRLFIKKANNRFATFESGKVWSLPVLGESSRGLNFRYTNGRTPQGIYEIKGVMPEANNPHEYGVFRRLKIDYIKNVAEVFLPQTHHHLTWFKEATLSHLLGRSLFRIHGTGVKNLNPHTSYFLMVRSSGCLTVRELKIGPFWIYRDQRKFLDKLMSSQGLKAEFKSETNIESLLYVVNFSGKLRHIKFNT